MTKAINGEKKASKDKRNFQVREPPDSTRDIPLLIPSQRGLSSIVYIEASRTREKRMAMAIGGRQFSSMISEPPQSLSCGHLSVQALSKGSSVERIGHFAISSFRHRCILVITRESQNKGMINLMFEFIPQTRPECSMPSLDLQTPEKH